MKYRKKPVVVEVIQISEEKIEEIIKFQMRGDCAKDFKKYMTPFVGDYLILGGEGDVSLCKADMLEYFYEKVQE